MTLYYQDERVTVHAGDCLDVLATLPDASVDAVVTDPPYGLEFMGKEWDKFRVDDPGTKRHRGDRAAAPAMEHDASTAPRDPNKPWQKERSAYTIGARARTYRCDDCGKRDQFRNPHNCTGSWVSELVNPHAAPPGSLALQAWCELWAAECLRVLKPGGHLLAFGGTRTSHRLACAIEDAGFEIRDSIAWLYGSGFPKSLDVSKAIDKAAGASGEYGEPKSAAHAGWIDRGAMRGTGGHEGYQRPWMQDEAAVDKAARQYAPATDDARTWQGWGTALKPAHEPIVVARKPLAGTVAANVLRHGTGALNIDGCRVGTGADKEAVRFRAEHERTIYSAAQYGTMREDAGAVDQTIGRWPANVVLDESQAAALDQQSGQFSGVASGMRQVEGPVTFTVGEPIPPKRFERGVTDFGGASRFFYVAKADSAERPRINGTSHPTVKPLALMRWLVRLVCPPGGTVLEPFAGSGATVEACVLEGFRCIAIERETDYLPLITSRLNQGTFDFGEELA